LSGEATWPAQIYSNVEVLKIATSGNCELFATSGERNP
jgi:hypothetical protein